MPDVTPPPMPPPMVAPKRGMPTWAWLVIAAVMCVPCIAIFAAILFPVFSQARYAAKATASLSNIKQIGIGQAMYSADFDDRFSPADRWEEHIFPYTKNTDILKDPTSEPPGAHAYAMNDAASTAKMEWIDSPQTTVLMFASTEPGPSAHGGASLLRTILSDRAIVAFTDTSAKQLRGPSRDSLVWAIPRPAK